MKRDAAFRLIAFFLIYLNLLFPTIVLADSPGAAGFVASLQGRATVTHAAAPGEPSALKFRDPVFGRDKIVTKEESVARVLLGGKALITVRELSELTITEEPGKPSFIDILKGKIALAVAHQRMNPGESIEVRTPNAVAAVRGTVIIVEVEPAPSPSSEAPDYRPVQASFAGQAMPVQQQTFTTNFHVIKGNIEVFSLTQPGGQGTNVGAGLSVTATGGTIGVPKPSPPAGQLVQGLSAGPQHSNTPSEANNSIANQQLNTATTLGNIITGGGPPPITVINPVLPTTGQNLGGGGVGTSSPLIALNNVSVNVDSSLASISGGSPPNNITITLDSTPILTAVGPNPDISGPGGGATFQLTNSKIDGGDPLFDVNGTTMTAAGTLLTASGVLAGESLAIDSESFLNLNNAASVTIGGALVLTNGANVNFSDTVISVNGGSSLIVNGTAISVDNSTLNTDYMAYVGGCECSPSSLTVNGTFLNLTNNATVNVNEEFLEIDGGGDRFVITGQLINATNSTINVYSDFFDICCGASFTSTGGSPLISLTGSTLYIDDDILDLCCGSSMMLAGPLLWATNSIITNNDDFLDICCNATFTSTTASPLVSLVNSTFYVGEYFLYVCCTATVTLAGSLLSATNSAITVDSDFLNLDCCSGTFTSTTASPVIELTNNSSLDVSGSLLYMGSNTTMTIAGSLLSATDSSVTTSGDLIVVNSSASLTGNSTNPLVSLTRSPLTVGGNFLTVRGSGASTVTTFDENPPGLTPINGLSFKGVTYGFTIGGVPSTDANFGSMIGPGQITYVQSPSLEGNTAGVLTMTFASPVSRLQFGLALSTLAALSPGGTVTLRASDGTVLSSLALNTTPLVSFTEGQLIYSGQPVAEADISFSPSTPRFALDNLVLFSEGVLLNGPLLSAANSTISIGSDLIFLDVNSALFSFGSGALISLSGSSSLTVNGNLAVVNSGAIMFLAGSLLSATDSTVTVGNEVMSIYGQFTDTSTAPVVSLTNSTLNFCNSCDTFLNVYSGGTVDLTGSLLTLANNSTVSGDTLVLVNSGGSLITRTPSLPLVSVNNSILELGNLYYSNAGTANLAGPLLIATGGAGVSSYSLFQLNGSSTVTGTGMSSFIQVDGSGTMMDIFYGFLISESSTLTLAGPLFSITGGARVSLPFEGELLSVLGSTVTGTGTDPFIQVTNSSLTLADESLVVGVFSGTLTTGNATLMQLTGSNTSPQVVATGDTLTLGTDQPIHGPGSCPSCPLLSNTNLLGGNGASITTGSAVVLDTALLEATAPLISLFNSTMTSNSDLINLARNAQMNVTVPGDALVKLNASTLNVTGSLFSVNNGSYLNVTGSLFNLTNTSTLNINSGFLVNVTGGSVFNLSGGSLGLFGAGTNTLNLTNNAALCGGCSITTTIPNLGGYPVLLANGALASNVSVAPGFVPFSNLSASNKVNVSGTSGAVLALNGATSKVKLGP